MQHLALGLVELHEVHAGPPLQPVKVPLNGIPSLQRVNQTTQLGVVGKLAEGALSPTVHVADKDIKQHRPQYRCCCLPPFTAIESDLAALPSFFLSAQWSKATGQNADQLAFLLI